ncbi:MAG: PAS domain S-box protein [Calditrichaeota bacterium]|nr:PAS domain S-box protein [Calditrichota bacterium]
MRTLSKNRKVFSALFPVGIVAFHLLATIPLLFQVSARVSFLPERHVLLELFSAYIAFILLLFCLREYDRTRLREFDWWAQGLALFVILNLLQVFFVPGSFVLPFLSQSFNAAIALESFARFFLALYLAVGLLSVRGEASQRVQIWLASFFVGLALVVVALQVDSSLFYAGGHILFVRRILDICAILAGCFAVSILVNGDKHGGNTSAWLAVALVFGIFASIYQGLWQSLGDIFFEVAHVSKIIFLTLLFVGIVAYKRRLATSQRRLSDALSVEGEILLFDRSVSFEILNNLPQGLAITDANGSVKYCNPAFCSILKYDKASVIGLHVSTFFESTSYERVAVAGVQPQTESGSSIEVVLLDKNTEKVYGLANVIPVFGKGDGVDGTQYIITDLTEQKRVQFELQEAFQEQGKSLETFRQGIEHSTEGILITDLDGRINYANRAFQEMSGYQGTELLGKEVVALAYNQRSEIALESIGDLMKEGRVWRGEFHTKRKDGSGFIGELSVVPIEDKDSPRIRCLWIEQDITRRKTLERSVQEHAEKLVTKTNELEASRSYYESLISAMSDILLVVDNDGQCTFINDYGRKRLGFAADELSKKLLPIFFDDLKKLEKDYGTAIQVEIKDYEVLIKPRDGDAILCSWYARPLFDSNKRRIGAMAVGRDITEYKKLQDELEDYTHKLEAGIETRTAQLQKKVKQLGKLLEIGEEIGLNADVDVIINKICEGVHELGWGKAVISLRDAEKLNSRTVATAGLDPKEVEQVMTWGDIPFEHTEKYFKERFRISRSYFIPKEENLISADTPYAILTKHDASVEGGWQSLDALLVPIRTKDKILGLISVDDPADGQRPGLDQIRDLEIFADKAALAIENARLFQAQKENQRESKFLAEIGKLFHSSLNVDEVLEAVVKKAGNTIGEFCTLLLVDERNEVLRPEASFHHNPGTVDLFVKGTEAFPCLAGVGIVGAVMTTGKASLASSPFDEELSETMFCYLDERYAISSIMCVPLRVRGRMLGVMVYLLFDAKRQYRNDEIRLAQELADRASMALENARLFDETRQKAVELEKANKMKSEFLANVSHELRTPLNAIITLSDIQLSTATAKEDAERRKQLEIIQRSGKNLLSLINDILDLSKIESGRIDPVYSEIPIRAVVEETVEEIRPLCIKKGLALEYGCARNVPKMFFSDQDKLTKALTNILSNAVKFTRSGGITVGMSMKSKAELQIRVVDTGIGIPSDRVQEVFKEFHQIDSTDTRQYGGTGLGLAITKKVMDIIGGQVLVESRLGKGSTFTMVVPVKSKKDLRGQNSVTEIVGKVTRPPEEGISLDIQDDRHHLVRDKKRILIIDDEKESLYIMSHYLRENHYQVVFPANGEPPLALARQYHPFAITLDIIMPGKSGWEILDDLKTDSETKDIPVIITSILSERERALQLGADEYLVKPIQPKKLLAHLASFEKRRKKKSNLLDFPRFFNLRRTRPQKPLPEPNGDEGGAPSTILLVDDDKDTQYALQLILEGAGYQVHFANEGREALRLAESVQPNLILMDIMMPGMDGYETTRNLKSQTMFKNTPVVAMTAKAMKGDREKTLMAGCDDYIAKPFVTADLLRLVEKWLRVAKSN